MASSCEHLERLSAEDFPPQKTPGACEECLTEGTVWVSGAVAAAIALATIVGNAVVDWFSQFCGRRTTLLLWASGVQTAAVVGVGVAGFFWLAVIFFLLVAAAMGSYRTVKQRRGRGKLVIAVVAQEASGGKV